MRPLFETIGAALLLGLTGLLLAGQGVLAAVVFQGIIRW
jgi:ABC-type iron transport system FetAB permease component